MSGREPATKAPATPRALPRVPMVTSGRTPSAAARPRPSGPTTPKAWASSTTSRAWAASQSCRSWRRGARSPSIENRDSLTIRAGVRSAGAELEGGEPGEGMLHVKQGLREPAVPAESGRARLRPARFVCAGPATRAGALNRAAEGQRGASPPRRLGARGEPRARWRRRRAVRPRSPAGAQGFWGSFEARGAIGQHPSPRRSIAEGAAARVVPYLGTRRRPAGHEPRQGSPGRSASAASCTGAEGRELKGDPAGGSGGGRVRIPGTASG